MFWLIGIGDLVFLYREWSRRGCSWAALGYIVHAVGCAVFVGLASGIGGWDLLAGRAALVARPP